MGNSAGVRRVGVLTGGGDCPGLNAVIRAVVKSAVNDYGWEAYGIEDGYDGLVKDRIRPLSYDEVSGILTLGGTILGASNTGNPFRYYERDSGEREPRDLSATAIEKPL